MRLSNHTHYNAIRSELNYQVIWYNTGKNKLSLMNYRLLVRTNWYFCDWGCKRKSHFLFRKKEMDTEKYWDGLVSWHTAVLKQTSYCSEEVFFWSDLLATLNGPNRDNIMHHFMVNQIPTELKLEFDRCWTLFICFTLNGYWLMPRNSDVHFYCNYMSVQYDQVLCHMCRWRNINTFRVKNAVEP